LGEERLAGDHIRIDTRLLEVPEMVVEGGSVPALLGQMRLQHWKKQRCGSWPSTTG